MVVTSITNLIICHNWKFSDVTRIVWNYVVFSLLSVDSFARNSFNKFSAHWLLMLNIKSKRGFVWTWFTPLLIIEKILYDAQAHIIVVSEKIKKGIIKAWKQTFYWRKNFHHQMSPYWCWWLHQIQMIWYGFFS